MNRISTAPAMLSAAAALLFATPGQADDGLAEAIAGGSAGLDLRYRYEFVDQDGFDENANASTLLMRLDYETAKWRDFSVYTQFDHVFDVVLRDFNSGAGTSSADRNRYPVVADPSGPDLNQLYLKYAPGEDWDVRIGRRRILLDDERYVGGVGWRQNEQTYDGVSFDYSGWDNATVFYSYVANVNRIFGTTVPAGDHRQDTHLLNANVALSKDWTVIGYAYLIDNEDQPSFSTNTFGLRAEGGLDLGGGRLALLGEAASQSDAANAPASYDTAYYRLQGIWSGDVFSVGLGAELLGSDNGQGFRTPLATLHAFNGWADLFLATPAEGLEDVYLRVGAKARGWQANLIYHDFSADAGNADFGTEIDASASRKLGDRYSLLLKFARFSSDDTRFPDTTKFWLMLTAGF